MDAQLLILIASFVLLLVLDVPIAVCLGVAAVLSLQSAIGDMASTVVAQRMTNGVASFPLLAIPSFIVAGRLMAEGGMAGRLIDFAASSAGTQQCGASLRLHALLHVVRSHLRIGHRGSIGSRRNGAARDVAQRLFAALQRGAHHRVGDDWAGDSSEQYHDRLRGRRGERVGGRDVPGRRTTGYFAWALDHRYQLVVHA